MLAIGILALALAGCGSSESNGAKASSSVAYMDDEFISDLAKALEARWAIADIDKQAEATETREEYYKRAGKAVDAELEILESYSSAQFNNTTLQAKAIQYINTLKAQKDALQYASSDFVTYDTAWNKATDERTRLLKEFVDNYGLEVSDSKADILKELITRGALVEDKANKEEQVDAICASMVFEPADERSAYAAVAENTSDIDFTTFAVSVNLLDANGVILQSTYASVDNWRKGEKARFKFYASEDFASVSVKSSHWAES